MRGKCIRCLEPGHHWNQCKACTPPAPDRTSGGGVQAQNNGGETVCCLAKCMLGTNDDSGSEERSEDMGEKWIADSGASCHITHSADLLSGFRLCDDKVGIVDNHLIDIVGYGTLTVVFPGHLAVKPLDVAYVLHTAFNSFSLMATYKQRLRFTTEEEGMCISLLDGRSR